MTLNSRGTAPKVCRLKVASRLPILSIYILNAHDCPDLRYGWSSHRLRARAQARQGARLRAFRRHSARIRLRTIHGKTRRDFYERSRPFYLSVDRRCRGITSPEAPGI